MRAMRSLAEVTEQMSARPTDLLRRPKPLRACGMCGATFGAITKATKDHVLPDGFFGTPAPPNLPTWQVCRPCQDDLSPREERIRNLCAGAYSHHPDLIAATVDRASRSGRPPRPTESRWLLSPSGVTVPARIVVPDAADLDPVFRKITRGLYWYRHHRLPSEPRLVVRLMSSDSFSWWSNLVAQPVQKLGDEFWWMSAHEDGDDTWAIWLFVVLGALPVGVWMGRAADLPNLPETTGVALRR